jgi:hypothetical protein
MGYTTDFQGKLDFNKPLSDKMFNYLKLFSETRRMKRNVSDVFGIEGEFFVFGSDDWGHNQEKNIVDYNQPPSTQPGLWLQWIPTEDKLSLEWDGNEKFYSYTEWLVYLIHKILAPNGYVLNGTIQWQGEENGDVGEIFVENNRVYTQAWKKEKIEVTPQTAGNYAYVNSKFELVKNFMRTDVVLLLDEVTDLALNESVKLLT